LELQQQLRFQTSKNRSTPGRIKASLQLLLSRTQILHVPLNQKNGPKSQSTHPPKTNGTHRPPSSEATSSATPEPPGSHTTPKSNPNLEAEAETLAWQISQKRR